MHGKGVAMLEYDYEKMYDSFLGIDTKEPEWDSEGEAAEFNRYEVTPYEALAVACEQLKIKETDCVVDFGCGKGRVLFFFNNFFQCRVKGVEYDRELYDLCDDNKCYYGVRFHGRDEKIELYHTDAVDYAVDRKDNVFYFFNPCSPEKFRKVLESVLVSVDETPRVVTILLYYASEDYLKIIRDMGWVQKKLIKLPGYAEDPDEKMSVYRNELYA